MRQCLRGADCKTAVQETSCTAWPLTRAAAALSLVRPPTQNLLQKEEGCLSGGRSWACCTVEAWRWRASLLAPARLDLRGQVAAEGLGDDPPLAKVVHELLRHLRHAKKPLNSENPETPDTNKKPATVPPELLRHLRPTITPSMSSHAYNQAHHDGPGMLQQLFHFALES